MTWIVRLRISDCKATGQTKTVLQRLEHRWRDSRSARHPAHLQRAAFAERAKLTTLLRADLQGQDQMVQEPLHRKTESRRLPYHRELNCPLWKRGQENTCLVVVPANHSPQDSDFPQSALTQSDGSSRRARIPRWSDHLGDVSGIGPTGNRASAARNTRERQRTKT